MAEQERTAFEERFVADEGLFEQISVVEDELIESYVRGELTVAEKEKCESLFLSTEPRRRRVAFTRAMLEKLDEQKDSAAAVIARTATKNRAGWNGIVELFNTPRLAFGVAFALLLLVSGGWFLLRSPKQPDVAQTVSPTPAAEPNQIRNDPTNENVPLNSNADIGGKIPDNKNAPTTVNKDLPGRNQNMSPSKQTSTIATPVLALFTGTVRSGGKMAELNLPKNAAGANLELNLESQDYKIYQVEIVDPDGVPVMQNNRLKAKTSKLNLFVPAKKLRRGDYIVKVSALNQQREIESVADYSFRIIQK